MKEIIEMKNKLGCTRYVFLTRRYAIKVPQFKYEWRHFLLGLLANMQEVSLYTTKDSRLCPILFYILGGWLIVMPRCKPISREDFMNLDIHKFWTSDIDEKAEWYIPVENKQDSFGWLNNKIVALDYGS